MSELAIHGGKRVRTAPWPAWPMFDQREIDAVTEVIKSGKWGCNTGTQVRDFQKEFAEFCGAKHCICLTNGTAALEVALRAVGVRAGDEVIVPAYTFVATASCALMANAIPVFVDIQPGTYNMDPEAVRRAITERTKAIVPVHLGGRPADMDAIMAIAERHKLKVVEDCAQAHAAEWKGRKVGTLGHAGAFSFQASKNINSGEGGCILTNDDEVMRGCYSLVNLGRVIGGEWYQHDHFGSNFRMTEFQAAILRVQLTRLPEQAALRERNAAYLDEQLSKIDGVRPMGPDPRITRNAYHGYIFRYDARQFNGAPKAKFLQAVGAEGVPLAGLYGKPLYKEKLFQDLMLPASPLAHLFHGHGIDYASLHLPVVERISVEESIWVGQRLLLGTKEDMDDIVAAIAKVRKHCGELAK